MTIGIDADHPSPAFGYIHLGDPLRRPPGGVRRCGRSSRSRRREVAAGYLATGRYRWNAGMFVVRPAVLLDLLGARRPRRSPPRCATIAADPARLDELWPTLPKIAVDHAVAEPAADAGRVATVPAAFGWDDIGDFDSLADAARRRGPRHRARRRGRWCGRGRAPAWSCPAAGRMVAVVGLDDVVVVDTPDAVLVTTRGPGAGGQAGRRAAPQGVPGAPT